MPQHLGRTSSAANLCREAIRLGHLLVEVMPDARKPTLYWRWCFFTMHGAKRDYAGRRRRFAGGANRSRWDKAQIAEGLSRIELRCTPSSDRAPTRCKSRSRCTCERNVMRTPTAQIAGLYEVLMRHHSLSSTMRSRCRWWNAPSARCGWSTRSTNAASGQRLSHAPRRAWRPAPAHGAEAATAYRQALKGADLEPERRFLAARLAN